MTKQEYREFTKLLKDKSKMGVPRCYCNFHSGNEKKHLKEMNRVATRADFKVLVNKINNGVIDIDDVTWRENQDEHSDKWSVC